MTCQQRPAITREQELELLAEIYQLALESYQKRKPHKEKAGAPDNDTGSDMRGESRSDSHAAKKIS